MLSIRISDTELEKELKTNESKDREEAWEREREKNKFEGKKETPKDSLAVGCF